MNEQKNQYIKIITNSGFKYQGKQISETSTFIEINDDKEGIIKIPLASISFLKEVL